MGNNFFLIFIWKCRFVDEFNRIIVFKILNTFGWASLSIASSLLGFLAELVKWTGHFNLSDDVVKSAFSILLVSVGRWFESSRSDYTCDSEFWSFATVFYFSEFGEMVAHKFQIFHDHSIRCKWYLFPLEMQRSFVIFLLDVQQSINIRGYGNIVCTRGTFKEALNFIFDQLLPIYIRDVFSFSFSV